MRHDMESCDQGREDRDEAWLDGPVASMKSKSETLKRGTAHDGEAWARLGADGSR
jgi:Leu/Phe-tRNA-protein transferase